MAGLRRGSSVCAIHHPWIVECFTFLGRVLNDFERGTKYYLFVLINRWRIVRKTGRSEYFVDGI